MSSDIVRYGGRSPQSEGRVPQCNLLLSMWPVPTTAISRPCEWSGYDLLIFEAVSYYNITGSVVVPSDYFAETTASVRVLVTDPINNKHYQVYQNGSSAVYVLGNETAEQGRGVRIYGIIFGE